MKRIMAIAVMVIIALCATSAPVSAQTSDKGLVKSYCKAQYKGYKVKYVKEGSRAVLKRTGKRVVYVEVLRTKAKGGKNGRTAKGYFVKYPKKAKKGARVKVYLVYNPKSNAPDDVVAVVALKKIKADKPKKVAPKAKKAPACPYCDGASRTCVFWVHGHNDNGNGWHMTEAEQEDFLKQERREI